MRSTVSNERDIKTSPSVVTGSGIVTGLLGGLVGVGGAEFRLPLLIGVFRFSALKR
jgi:hypothetical protein